MYTNEQVALGSEYGDGGREGLGDYDGATEGVDWRRQTVAAGYGAVLFYLRIC